MQKKQVFNPYLASYDYIPDGEPRVFGHRLYIYGSHDRFNGSVFCQNDYVCWSAPVHDLSDWKYEGVILKKTADPRNRDGAHAMWAPDVCQGNDGKFYLYYCLDYLKEVGVAVADSPAGPYEFLDFVRYKDGRPIGGGEGEIRQFDPGIFIDDDKRIYLFSGNGPRLKTDINIDKASLKMELEQDMVTVKDGPFRNLPIINETEGTGYEAHPFFEASSVRKINGKYYFIYSSCHMHELCYAVADSPLGDYRFGGVLVSNADIGAGGNTEELNYLGNTHGSVCQINGQWYVFYHRQTNRHSFSRQACCEKIFFDGEAFKQAEITSCGLNDGPLKDIGTYEARIACHLYSKNGACESRADYQDGNHPAFTQEGIDREDNPDQYINNMADGATAGYRYFDFGRASTLTVKVRGNGTGKFIVKDERIGNPNVVAEVKIAPCKSWTEFSAPLKVEAGKKPLYFTYTGEGSVDFSGFTLS